jgi:hypothetical protein
MSARSACSAFSSGTTMDSSLRKGVGRLDSDAAVQAALQVSMFY